MRYAREAAFIRDGAGSELLAMLKKHGGFIAGGAVTSVFSSAHVNDFDCFFFTPEQAFAAIAEVPRTEKTLETDSAFSFISNGKRVQFVKVVSGDLSKVIQSFDFTICQGAFDLDDGFVLADGFLQHLAQRRLVFNISAEYPICSLYRARKFIKRGFHMSGIDAIKLGLRIQSLRISTYADLRKQLMGIDTLFLKDLTDSLVGQEGKSYDFNEFLATLEVWLDKLDALSGESSETA